MKYEEHYTQERLDRWDRKWSLPRAKIAFSLLRPTHGSILDVAGYKGILKTLLPKGVDYTLIDITNGFDLNHGIPFSKKFDYIAAMDIVGHVNEPRKLLSEIRRVLKPDGVALISIMKGIEHTPCTERDISDFFRIESKAGYIGGILPIFRVPVAFASEVFYLVK